MSMFTNTLGRARILFENRYEPEYSRKFANLYWHTILTLLVLCIIVASGYGTIAFFDVLSWLGSNSTVHSHGTAAATIDQTKITAVVEGFTARQANFLTLETAPIIPVADPSR